MLTTCFWVSVVIAPLIPGQVGQVARAAAVMSRFATAAYAGGRVTMVTRAEDKTFSDFLIALPIQTPVGRMNNNYPFLARFPIAIDA